MPNLDWNNMTGWYGGEEGGHIGFSPVAPLTGRDALAVRDLLRGMIEERPASTTSPPLSPINARSFVHVTMVIFDTKDEAQARARLRHAQAARARGGQAGLRRVPRAPRLHGPRGRPVLFNDHAYRRFTETIKDALDPNGILSPGKQGIWPRAMRNGARPG